jgi:hypothetical protein
MQPAEVPEGMVNLAHAFVEAEHLRAWFYALERLPVSVRETAFSEMAAQMRNAGEVRDLRRQSRRWRMRKLTKAFWKRFENVLGMAPRTPNHSMKPTATAGRLGNTFR